MRWLRRRPKDDWLDRVLGPAEPELSCDECFERLDEHVELELAGRGPVPEMEAHLRGCAACREEHALLRSFVEAHG